MDVKSGVTPPSLSLGIEEEYQTVDPETRDLRSHIQAEIVQKGKMILAERVKPEMHGSVVEIGTSVYRTIDEAKGGDPAHPARGREAGERERAMRLLGRGHASLLADWQQQEIYPTRSLPACICTEDMHADGAEPT